MAVPTVTSDGTLVPDGSTRPAAPATGRRALLLKLGRLALSLAIAASITYFVVQLWPEVEPYLASLSAPIIIGSLLAALAGMAANVMAWHAVLRELDHDVPVLESGRIYLVGQLGKYLPGSVWAFVMQMELSRRAGVPRARAFAGSLVLVGLSTTAAVLVGILGIPALVDAGGSAVWAIAALAPIALVCALPPVLSRLVDLFLRILRRPGLGHRLTARGLAPVIGWSVVAWFCFGTQLWLLSLGAAPSGADSWLRAVGAFALAMTAGLLAVVAPSGLGAREAVLVAGLAPVTGAGTALGIALASRLVFTVADVIAAGAAALSARHALDGYSPSTDGAPATST